MSHATPAVILLALLAACGEPRRAPDGTEDPVDAGCTPKTCEDAAGACGDLDDGCGGTIACGCAAPDTCGGGGTPGRCGAQACAGTLCGEDCVTDFATDSAHCGDCETACPSGHECAAGRCACASAGVRTGCPTNHVCDAATQDSFACFPTCEPVRRDCGGGEICTPVLTSTGSYSTQWDCYPNTAGRAPGQACTTHGDCRADSLCGTGTGGAKVCAIACDTSISGSCATGTTCTAVSGRLGYCKGSGSCQPRACGARVCGSIDDGCGHTISCGSCGSNQTCTAQGTCTGGCVAATCGSRECGSINDGCGHTVVCGSCGEHATCEASGQCACVAETDAELCTAGMRCGAQTVTDRCGIPREVTCTPCELPSSIVAPTMGGAEAHALAFDAAGNPHVYYVDASAPVVRHAWRTNGTWTREVVDPEFPWDPGYINYLDAVIGSDGRHHVSYEGTQKVGSTTTRLRRFATRAGGSWLAGPAPTDGPLHLAVDAQGNVLAAGAAAYTGAVHVWRLGAGAWTSQEVVSSSYFPSSFNAPILALDAAGKPWVAFERYSSSGLAVAAPTATGWTIGTPPAMRLPAPEGFRIDSGGSAHLLSDKYVFGAGQFWTTEEETGNAIVFDAQGRTLSVGNGYWDVFRPPTQFPVVVRRREASGWATIATHAFDPAVGTRQYWRPEAPVFNPAQQPVVLSDLGGTSAYGEPTGVQYAEFPGTAQQAQDVDVKSGVASPMFAIGPDGAPRVLYQETITTASGASIDSRTVVVKRTGTTWTPRVVAGVKYPAAFVVGADGYERYLEIVQGATYGTSSFKLTTDAANGPSSETFGIDPTFASMTFDPSGRAHVVYLGRDEKLHYQRRDAGGWSTPEAVTNTATPNARPQIVANASEAFIAWSNSFARKAGSVWQVAAIESYSGMALTLDEAQRACVVVQGAIENGAATGVRLDCLQNGSFESRVLATSPLSVLGAARDAQGRVHALGWRDSYFEPRVVVFLDPSGSGWTRRDFAAVNGPAYALAPDGTPWIVTLDEADRRIHAFTP